jgi:hypothetical protein
MVAVHEAAHAVASYALDEPIEVPASSWGGNGHEGHPRVLGPGSGNGGGGNGQSGTSPTDPPPRPDTP